MSRISHLAAILAELRAKSLESAGAGVVAAALTELGCTATPWDNGLGVTVSQLDGDAHLDAARDAKLADLRTKGFNPLVVITVRLRAEQPGDRSGRDDLSVGPATPIPTRNRSTKDE